MNGEDVQLVDISDSSDVPQCGMHSSWEDAVDRLYDTWHWAGEVVADVMHDGDRFKSNKVSGRRTRAPL